MPCTASLYGKYNLHSLAVGLFFCPLPHRWGIFLFLCLFTRNLPFVPAAIKTFISMPNTDLFVSVLISYSLIWCCINFITTTLMRGQIIALSIVSRRVFWESVNICLRSFILVFFEAHHPNFERLILNCLSSGRQAASRNY